MEHSAHTNIETEVQRVSFIKKIFDIFNGSSDKRLLGKIGLGWAIGIGSIRTCVSNLRYAV